MEGNQQNEKILAFLLDIEGTTTPISFVKDVLFPYVRTHLNQYLIKNWNDKQLQEDIALLRKQSIEDFEKGEAVETIPLEDSSNVDLLKRVEQYVLWQMDLDRKTTSLKQLQGHIWKEGYSDGNLKAPVFDDVKPAIEQWNREGRKVYIYSSGSVQAQKLLFGNTRYGDLLPLISGYFDTNVGAKTNLESYKNIAEEINLKPNQVLFLTDIPAEAKAAKEAGLRAKILLREGNQPLTVEELNQNETVPTFSNIEE